MSIYWTLNRIPELDGLSKNERQRVHKQCVEKYAWKSPACIATFIFCICIVVGGIASANYVSDLFQHTSISQRTLSPAIGGGIGGAIASVIWRHVTVREMRPRYSEIVGRQKKSGGV